MPESDDITRLKQYVEGDHPPSPCSSSGMSIWLFHRTAAGWQSIPGKRKSRRRFSSFWRRRQIARFPDEIVRLALSNARLAAANILRSEIRRQKREQEADTESLLNEPTPSLWQQIAPLLDDAMGHLSEKIATSSCCDISRTTGGEIGVALGIDSATAQKRITRAVRAIEKVLRKAQRDTFGGIALPGQLQPIASRPRRWLRIKS